MKKLSILLSIISILSVSVYAQDVKINMKSDKNSKAAMVKIKQDSLVDVYIDGKRYDSEILDIIDRDKIERINILKGDKAIDKYGYPRIIEISTKAAVKDEIVVKGYATAKKEKKSIQIRANDDGNIEIGSKSIDKPLIVIDGEIADKDKVKALDPNDIESVSILKDKSATALYGSKGKNGVVIIELKEWKKSKKKD